MPTFWVIWVIEFWYFPPIFVQLKLACLVTLFDLKLRVFKNSPKLTIFGIFWLSFVHSSYCKRSSLRSQCWMRLFSNFQLLCGLQDYWVATIRSSLSSRLQPSQLAKINGLCIWVDLLLWGISARPILYSVYSSPGRMPMPPPQSTGWSDGESCNHWNAGAPLVILDDGKLSRNQQE